MAKVVADLLADGHLDNHTWQLLAIPLPNPSEGLEGMAGPRRGQLVAIRDALRGHIQAGKPTPRVPEELKALVMAAMAAWREHIAVFGVITGQFSLDALATLGVTLPRSLARQLRGRRDAPIDDLEARLLALGGGSPPPSHTTSHTTSHTRKELLAWLRQTVQSDRSLRSVAQLQARVSGLWDRREGEERERRERARRERERAMSRASALWDKMWGGIQNRRDRADASRLKVLR